MTKMSDDEVKAFFAAARGDVACDEDAVRQWLARGATHIEALTAERDEASALITENAQLRERVNALEAECTMRRTQQEVAEARSTQAERARDDARTNAQFWHTRADSAETRLAAIRQRAGDEQACEAQALGIWFDVPDDADDATIARAMGVGMARYILGDDAPEHEVDGLQEAGCVNQKPRSPDSVRHLAQLVRSVESHAQQLADTPAAPTTAEALATVRDACSRVASTWVGTAPNTSLGDQSLTALADAPKVYTREEVAAAIVAELESPGNCGVAYVDCCAAACDGVAKRLTALRRKP